MFGSDRNSRIWSITLAAGVSCAVAIAAAGGCTGSGATGGPASTTVSSQVASTAPSIRLYLLSNVAGALEPCGCSKDQLGGAAHFAAFLAAEKPKAPNSVIVGAGP